MSIFNIEPIGDNEYKVGPLTDNGHYTLKAKKGNKESNEISFDVDCIGVNSNPNAFETPIITKNGNRVEITNFDDSVSYDFQVEEDCYTLSAQTNGYYRILNCKSSNANRCTTATIKVVGTKGDNSKTSNTITINLECGNKFTDIVKNDDDTLSYVTNSGLTGDVDWTIEEDDSNSYQLSAEIAEHPTLSCNPNSTAQATSVKVCVNTGGYDKFCKVLPFVCSPNGGCIEPDRSLISLEDAVYEVKQGNKVLVTGIEELEDTNITILNKSSNISNISTAIFNGMEKAIEVTFDVSEKLNNTYFTLTFDKCGSGNPYQQTFNLTEKCSDCKDIKITKSPTEGSNIYGVNTNHTNEQLEWKVEFEGIEYGVENGGLEIVDDNSIKILKAGTLKVSVKDCDITCKDTMEVTLSTPCSFLKRKENNKTYFNLGGIDYTAVNWSILGASDPNLEIRLVQGALYDYELVGGTIGESEEVYIQAVISNFYTDGSSCTTSMVRVYSDDVNN